MVTYTYSAKHNESNKPNNFPTEPLSSIQANLFVTTYTSLQPEHSQEHCIPKTYFLLGKSFLGNCIAQFIALYSSNLVWSYFVIYVFYTSKSSHTYRDFLRALPTMCFNCKSISDDICIHVITKNSQDIWKKCKIYLAACSAWISNF